MHPFIFFAIILIAIWILSSIASAISKQQDAARRRQVRQTIDPLARTRAPAYRLPSPTQQQQLNAGYQFRHPEMLAPRPIPPPVPRRPQQQQPQRRPAARRPGQAAMPPPPMPVQPAQAGRAAAPRAAAAQPVSVQAVKAPAISRWLKPATLRQQFILTEVFQPPVVMREERFG
jgi:hypothetical protein